MEAPLAKECANQVAREPLLFSFSSVKFDPARLDDRRAVTRQRVSIPALLRGLSRLETRRDAPLQGVAHGAPVGSRSRGNQGPVGLSN
jgi:hypothetical protein